MRKVTYASTHAEVFIPNVGQLGKVFPSKEKTLTDLEMSHSVEGLTMHFSYKNPRTGQTNRAEVLIPSANVVLMVLAPEEKPVKAVKAVA